MATVLVVGGTGFVGSNLVAELLRDTQARPWSAVHVLARSDASADKVRAMGAVPVAGDLLAPDDHLSKAVRNADWVIHCAQPQLDQDPALRSQMDDALLSRIDSEKTRRYLYVCGSSWFGKREGSALMNEEVEPEPFGVGPFFRDGLSGLQRARKAGLDAVAAYVAGVYGIGSWFLGLCQQSIVNQQPVVVADPVPLWPYIHVEDCARALIHLMLLDSAELDAVGRDVILADDEPVPMDAFITEVYRALGVEPELQRLPHAEIRARLPAVLAAYWTANMPHSNARLRATGFRCRYPNVREGVAALQLAPRS